jgi:hypothetical protein
MNQRWLFGGDRCRPAGETIQTRLYDVAPIEKDAPAKQFVLTHHYSDSYPAARFRFGMYRAADLVGIAVFSVPMNYGVFAPLKAPPDDCAELGRFVLLDNVPGNGETWFLGRCFDVLRRDGLAGVVSFSDPGLRTNARGQLVFGGHYGCIYQAFNGVYLGRGTARWIHLLPDGTALSDRLIAKMRAKARGKERKAKGWLAGVRKLMEHGADVPGNDLCEWLDHWIPLLTRRQWHPGNHKYAWGLCPSVRRALPASLAYPKPPIKRPSLQAPGGGGRATAV